MTVNIWHLVEVSFDGVGGAALIAFITAWSERRRSAKSENKPKAVAVANQRRFKTLIPVAAAVFVVSFGVGAIFHFSHRTPAQSVSNRRTEPSISSIHPQPPAQTPGN